MVKVRSIDEFNYRRIRGVIRVWLDGGGSDSWLVGQLKTDNKEEIRKIINAIELIHKIEPIFEEVEKGGRTIQKLKELLQIR